MTELLFFLVSCGASCAIGVCLGVRRERGIQARRDQIKAAVTARRRGGVKLSRISATRR